MRVAFGNKGLSILWMIRLEHLCHNDFSLGHGSWGFSGISRRLGILRTSALERDELEMAARGIAVHMVVRTVVQVTSPKVNR